MSRLSPWSNGPSGSSTIASPTFTGPVDASGATGLTVPVYRGGVPFIGLSSGSVSAVGAITGITALPAAYPSAYCYFPANIVATVAAAGWYYCTFSTTTAGIVFLDTYTSGQATIPASPTPVTDGKGAFTGTTTEDVGISFSLPALTANSSLVFPLIAITATNNANAKNVRFKIGATTFLTGVGTSVAASSWTGHICNTGATNRQLSSGGAFASSITAAVLGTIDTSVTTTFSISLQRATATDNLVLLPPTILLSR